MNEIEYFNPLYGLVKTESRKELIIKHILDSIAPLGHIARFLNEHNAPHIAADIGSGAGLPGIPLALCLPDVQFNLVERMKKRSGFLQSTIAVLGLTEQVVVEETDAEKSKGGYDFITFRALSPLTPAFTVTLKKLLRLSKHRAGIAAYKGKLETAKKETEFLSEYNPVIIPIHVPFLEEERCLVLIKL